MSKGEYGISLLILSWLHTCDAHSVLRKKLKCLSFGFELLVFSSYLREFERHRSGSSSLGEYLP